MSDILCGWKVLTHSWRSPIQGGPPICNGTLPCTLPTISLDMSGADCAAGWNYTADLKTALSIAGFWPNGRPSRAFVVEASPDAIERGTKRRASSLTLVREATEQELSCAIDEFSVVFGAHAKRMADEQRAWRTALARPRRDAAAVERGLAAALRARGLDWQLKEHASARVAWAAWAARGAWDARDAWAARGAWDARGAWAVRDAWAARGAWGAWDARGARDAWAGWDARGARDALTVCFAALNAWIEESPEYFTVGIREAYENGLGLVVPSLPNVLSWSMDDAA